MVLVGAGEARRVELLPTEDLGEEFHAVLLLDPERTEAFLYVDGFPDLPPDKVYQFWLTQNGTHINAGLFRVDDEGSGSLFIETPEPLGQYHTVEVTLEPLGGSLGPTTPPIAAGKL